MAGKVYTSSCPDNPPEWYWINGLHDACIVGVETTEFTFDYDSFIKEKNKYNRNLMILKIDAKGALYDNSVKEIHLFNYKILSDNISKEGRKQVYWLADRLVDCGKYYTLEIDLHDLKTKPRDFTFKIKFERAEIIRG